MTAPNLSSSSHPLDRWLPRLFFFFFAGLAVVLGGFVWLAVRTNTGTVTDQAYQKGLAYNQTLAAAATAAQLGWRSTIGLTPTALTATVRDAADHPLDGLELRARIMRPTQAALDQAVVLAAQGDGRYTAALQLPARGVWDVQVAATRGDDQAQWAKRIILP